LTWGARRERKEERERERERKRIDDWERNDEQEWRSPSGKAGGGKHKSKEHQDLLRAFEWKIGGRERRSMDGRSVWSAVSPGTSRMGSVSGHKDDGATLGRVVSGGRRRSGGPLSREVSRQDGMGVGTVAEE